MSTSQNIVESSVKAASLNMLTQLAFRVFTFLMNAFVLRHISPDLLGLIYVRLNLLDDTIIFLSTEGFRLAGLGHKKDGSWQKTINLMWVTLPVSVLWSTVMFSVWTWLLPQPDPALQPQYKAAVMIVSVTAVLQMVAEAPLVAGQVLMMVRMKVVLNMVWMMTRVLVLCLAVKLYPGQVISMWAWGHALASILYVLGYYLSFKMVITANKMDNNELFPFKSLSELLPSSPAQFSVDPDQWKVASSFVGQAVVKQVLTDCEKYIMTIFNLLTLSEQGIFDVVSNLGSLAARFIFRPIEESSYFFFSQLWSRGQTCQDQKQEDLEKVKTGLFRLLRLMMYLGEKFVKHFIDLTFLRL